MDNSSFKDSLKRSREAMGFKTMKSFYFHLEKKCHQLLFNYPYYTQMETGRSFPSAKIVEQIAGLCPSEIAGQLVAAYCYTMFPTFKTAFNITESQSKKLKSEPQGGKKVLSLSIPSIKVIGRSRDHYLMFLIVVLMKQELSLVAIAEKLSISLARAKSTFEDLNAIRILRTENNVVLPYGYYFKFPRASEDSELKVVYGHFDSWEQEFMEIGSPKTEIKKTILQRTSSRLLPLLIRQCENLVDFVRSTEELDQSNNDRLIAFHLYVKSDSGDAG